MPRLTPSEQLDEMRERVVADALSIVRQRAVLDEIASRVYAVPELALAAMKGDTGGTTCEAVSYVRREGQGRLPQ